LYIIPLVNELFDTTTPLSQNRSKIRLDSSCNRLKPKAGGTVTPPLIKSFEGGMLKIDHKADRNIDHKFDHSNKLEHKPKKRNTSSSYVSEAYGKNDNSLVNIGVNNKRRSYEKVINADGSRSNSKGKINNSINIRPSVDLIDLCNKSLNNLHNKIKPTMSPVIHRSKKKAVTNNELHNKEIFNDKINSFNIEGATQIYVNQIMVDKGIPIKSGILTPTHIKENRKFSIMDVPASVIESNMNTYI
jgi:hypothetical protein